MLRKFKVKNYKGFKDEVILDLTNTKNYGFNNESIINQTIKNAIIYGKNGTGKSNLGLAIFDLTTHLFKTTKMHLQNEAYLNGDSDEDYASFEYEFLIEGIKFGYSYRKTSAERLIYESLFINDEKIFSYNFKTKIYDWNNLSIVKLTPNDLPQRFINSVISYVVDNKLIGLQNPITKFVDFVSRMLFFRTTVNGNEYIGLKEGRDFITKEIIKQNKIQDFEKFLRIYDLNYKFEVSRDYRTEGQLMIKYNNRSFPFLYSASNGTIALSVLFYWLHNPKQISFLFIDEFDAFYHTELAEKIIKDFAEKIDHQIIITTHNTNLMSNTLLRPDCYFIVTESRQIKSLPNTTERELREGHNLAKMYLGGSFDEE